MWITDAVDLPDELITAQAEGQLVIFAGAGVSMGTPSNLPSFTELADRIAQEAAVRAPTESLDQFLGRCERLSVDVQLRTREILSDPSSKPTLLHSALLELFHTADRVRLVTTNFDAHFTTDATARFGQSNVTIYRAPALPLGASVLGIVHVHGALDEPRHPLVLTDADFGKAYLTEGWATRFLLDLFLHNTVCFIGYGHNDPTIRYLARALVPGTARFAFTPAGQEDIWRELGVTPVQYPLVEGNAPHAALTEAIQKWAALSAMGALEHEHLIKELVGAPPPIEPSSISYLRASLAAPTRRVFFVRHARGPAWLEFARESGALDILFHKQEVDEDWVRELATWLAENYMLQYPHELLTLLRKMNMRLGHGLWQLLAWRLALRQPRPTTELLARWATVLVASRETIWSTRFLTSLLSACPPDALTTAVLLFAHLIEPRIVISDPWTENQQETPRLNAEVVPCGDHHELSDAWNKILLPQLTGCYPSIVAAVTASLEQSHTLLLCAGPATTTFDPLSYGRSAIEPHAQDAHPSGMDVVISAARDTLEYVIREHPPEGLALITLWDSSAAPLLRRLAIHGRTLL